ncbi:MAG: DUF2239 family protein [Hyphomicrobiaceae bacterium]|nr:DUF2239 family protein [Hyphomicrobiaceae bacterium]
MDRLPAFVAFVGPRCVASGPLSDILPNLKKRFESEPSEQILVFDGNTGKRVDLDLRGRLDDVLKRYSTQTSRGPGRPKLGVVGREVSLLPRHWDWLEEQPSGASAALRRLVEAAIRHEPGRERARRIREALSQFLSALAGDRSHYEDVCRALFAGETDQLTGLMARWPKDIRDYVLERAQAAAEAEAAK